MIPLLARAKVYLQRGVTYLSLLSQAMVLRLFLVSIGHPSWLLFLGIATAAAVALILLMYLEDRIGMFEAETEITWSRSPQLKRILDSLDESLERSETDL